VKVRSYWSWEENPAVIVDYGDGFSGGLYLEGEDWEEVTELEVIQWFKSGEELSKASFEERFGDIGGSLPPLPLT